MAFYFNFLNLFQGKLSSWLISDNYALHRSAKLNCAFKFTLSGPIWTVLIVPDPILVATMKKRVSNIFTFIQFLSILFKKQNPYSRNKNHLNRSWLKWSLQSIEFSSFIRFDETPFSLNAIKTRIKLYKWTFSKAITIGAIISSSLDFEPKFFPKQNFHVHLLPDTREKSVQNRFGYLHVSMTRSVKKFSRTLYNWTWKAR